MNQKCGSKNEIYCMFCSIGSRFWKNAVFRIFTQKGPGREREVIRTKRLSQIRAWWLRPVKVCGAGMASHRGSRLATLLTRTLTSRWMWLAPKIVTLDKATLYTWSNSCLGNTTSEVRKGHVLFHRLQAQQPPVPFLYSLEGYFYSSSMNSVTYLFRNESLHRLQLSMNLY